MAGAIYLSGISVKFILTEGIIMSAGRKWRKTLRSSESASPLAATYNYQAGTMHKNLKHKT